MGSSICFPYQTFFKFCVQDEKGVQVRLGTTHEGIVTFRDNIRTNIFQWYDFLYSEQLIQLRLMSLFTYLIYKLVYSVFIIAR